MRLLLGILAICLSLSTLTFAEAMESPQHKSFKKFCMEPGAAPPESCDCGLATADIIMSPKEQDMAIAILGGNSNVAKQLGEKHDAFMDKLAKVTKGCS